MLPYTTISQRLRRAEHRHEQRWQDLRAFAVVRQSGVVQVRQWSNEVDGARLKTALLPVLEAAAARLRRRYGLLGRNERRTLNLFRLFGRAHDYLPFDSIKVPPRYGHLRWIHEWFLMAAGAGMTSPLLNRCWSPYPWHGIPCGLRRDGTLILWIGPRGLRFPKPRTRKH